MNDHVKYCIPYGVWGVKTEANFEGRGTIDLGVYQGYIDEIAFALADKQMYALHFTKFDLKLPIPKTTPEKVNVVLDVESGLWAKDDDESLVEHFKQMLSTRDVDVETSCIYGAVTLKRHDLDEAKRQVALSKLTSEEKRLLGLTN